MGGGGEGGAPVLAGEAGCGLHLGHSATPPAAKILLQMQPQVAPTQQGGGGVDGQVPPQGPLRANTEDHCLESMSVLSAHHIIEDGVEGGGKEVEAAREVEEYLVDAPVERQVLEVDITKALEVERGPGNKEENHNRDLENTNYDIITNEGYYYLAF